MVKPIPIRFNPDLLARDAAMYTASIPLVQFTRLSRMVLQPEGNMEAELRFYRRKNHIAVSGKLSADITLVCQRCLCTMRKNISTQYELVFVTSELVAAQLPKELDPVILAEDGHMHVVDLFEDELLLQLPTIPKHEDMLQCAKFESAVQEANSEASRKPGPFDVLKKIDFH